MKTTIEIKGYQIVIDETEEMVSVTAVKDDETIEEFSLDLTEGGEEAQSEEGIKSFGDFGDEEEDFGGEESQEEDELQDEVQDELQDEEEDDDDSALESFQAFVNKRK